MATTKYEYIPTEERGVRRALGNLILNVRLFEAQMDAEMAKPSSMERDKRIAALMNTLILENDRALYHGLGFDFRKDNRRKKPNIAAIAKFSRRTMRRPD